MDKPQRKISLNDKPDSSQVPGVFVRLAKSGEFKPQSINANTHTPRGMGMLGDAMNRDGYVAPMTAAANGEIIDGSARLEMANDRLGEDIIVVEHDGTKPIVTVRTDISDADTDAARRISVAANRIAEVNLSWDIPILRELKDSNLLEKLWSEDEIGRLLQSFSVNETGAPEMKDGDRAPFRQSTFTLHDEQFEEVESALKKAKSQGGGKSAVNENSNGNALTWICQNFNRQDG